VQRHEHNCITHYFFRATVQVAGQALNGEWSLWAWPVQPIASVSGRTSSGLFQIAELPETGKLTVRVLRTAGSKRVFDIGDFAWEGPWIFEFRI
jgi:hypothetical protein